MKGNLPGKSRSASEKLSFKDHSHIAETIYVIRGERVILDSDLAQMFGEETRRLNEQVDRNRRKFGEGYSFQLTKDEWSSLKSQIAILKQSDENNPLKSQSAISKPGRGGRRTPPWVFTERGVVMAATVLSSDRAVEASRLIVDVFIEVRHRLAGESNVPVLDVETPSIMRLSNLGTSIGTKLQMALNHVLDSVVDTKRQTTVREEAQALIAESIQHLKDRLKKQGLENEEILARVTRLLAEAEKERAQAAKTRAETEMLEFGLIIKKLRLLMEVQKALINDDLDSFIGTLKELGDK